MNVTSKQPVSKDHTAQAHSHEKNDLYIQLNPTNNPITDLKTEAAVIRIKLKTADTMRKMGFTGTNAMTSSDTLEKKLAGLMKQISDYS
jgi:hypothetical protein